MKVTKSRLKNIVTEELQNILTEQEYGDSYETRIVPRTQLKKDAEASAKAKGKDPLSAMATKEVDMDAIIQQQIDSMDATAKYRDEA